MQVPVRGSRPRMERWTWTGEWRQDTNASAVRGPYERVDLGAVDVGRLFDNIGVARRTLDVEQGRFTHAILIRFGDGPTELNIYVGNDVQRVRLPQQHAGGRDHAAPSLPVVTRRRTAPCPP